MELAETMEQYFMSVEMHPAMAKDVDQALRTIAQEEGFDE
jgi:hypothetical protein